MKWGQSLVIWRSDEMLNINMVFMVLAEIFGVYFVVRIIPIPIPMTFYKVRSKGWFRGGALGVRWQASGCGGNCVDCVVARDWEDYCLILGTSGPRLATKLDSKCPRGGRYSYLGRCTSNTIMWLDLYNNAAHMCCKVDWPAYEALYGTCYCGIWVAPRGVPVICVIWGQFDL